MWDTNASTAAATAIESELGPDERLLWFGAPRGGLTFRPADIFFIPFSLIWGGFALFWEAMVLLSGASFIMALFGLPFVAIGLYLTVGRFFVDAKVREKTFYGLTNERAIIVSGLFNRTVNSIYLRNLGDISVEQRPDGSGDITFGPAHPMMLWASGMNMRSNNRYVPPRFELIPDVRHVAGIVREAQRQLAQPPTDGATRNLTWGA